MREAGGVRAPPSALRSGAAWPADTASRQGRAVSKGQLPFPLPVALLLAPRLHSRRKLERPVERPTWREPEPAPACQPRARHREMDPGVPAGRGGERSLPSPAWTAGSGGTYTIIVDTTKLPGGSPQTRCNPHTVKGADHAHRLLGFHIL